MPETKPLRSKVKAIENKMIKFEGEFEVINGTLKEFEDKIKTLTSEYKRLIAQCEQTRNEAQRVEMKLFRAASLLNFLSAEAKRWTEKKASFEIEIAHLLGHSILTAAFLTYVGFPEQQSRIDRVKSWMVILPKNNIHLTDAYQFSDFLSKPKQIIDWNSKGLPKDDL
jgi:hypothetical protein